MILLKYKSIVNKILALRKNELSKLKKVRKWIVTDTLNGLLLFTPRKIKQKGLTF